VFDGDKCRYMCFGRELCPSTGREHWQGFVVFNRTVRIPAAKRSIVVGDGECHLETRRGTRREARDYCAKDGEFREWGELELHSTKELFEKSITYIKEHNPMFYCRYHRGLEKLKADKGAAWRNVEVIYLWGDAGVGKTRRVMEMDDVYKIDPPYKWWDGYEGQSILLIDDYTMGATDRGYLLNLLDGYRMRLETKGGHTWALWTKVYMTSNWEPEKDKALLRRITEVALVTSDEVCG